MSLTKPNDLVDYNSSRVARPQYAAWGVFLADAYYIVDIKNLLKPRFFKRPFENENEALRAVTSRFKNDHKSYVVETGRTIAKYKLRPYVRSHRRLIPKKLTYEKYDYPLHRTTSASKKSFRVLSRRALRLKWLKKLET